MTRMHSGIQVFVIFTTSDENPSKKDPTGIPGFIRWFIHGFVVVPRFVCCCDNFRIRQWKGGSLPDLKKIGEAFHWKKSVHGITFFTKLFQWVKPCLWFKMIDIRQIQRNKKCCIFGHLSPMGLSLIAFNFTVFRCRSLCSGLFGATSGVFGELHPLQEEAPLVIIR